MALFARDIPFTFPDPDTVTTGDIASKLPDLGQALRDWYLWAMGGVPEVVESEIQRVRQGDGGYVVPRQLNRKGGGPLFLMGWIGQTDWIAMQVWARNNVRMPSAQKHAVDDYIHRVISSHGIPRAAACTGLLWSSAGHSSPRLETLAHLLSNSYTEHSGTMQRGWSADVIKYWRQ